jgi:Holliday junction resolvase RusA-like endonuclease
VTATISVLDPSVPEPITVVVEGRPAPKGSRIAGKTNKAYTYPASTYERGWVAEVTHATKLIMRHRETPEPPYEVRLTFYLAKGKKVKYPWPPSPDLDKLARAVIDGLVKGAAMVDDRHVCTLTAKKVFAAHGQIIGVHAEVLPLQDVWTDM